jgi:hypothetical protein
MPFILETPSSIRRFGAAAPASVASIVSAAPMPAGDLVDNGTATAPPTKRRYVVGTTNEQSSSGQFLGVKKTYATRNLGRYIGKSPTTGKWIPDPAQFPPPPADYPGPRNDPTVPLDQWLPPVKAKTRYGGSAQAWGWLKWRREVLWNIPGVTLADGTDGASLSAWALMTQREQSFHRADVDHSTKDAVAISNVAKIVIGGTVAVGLGAGIVAAALPAAGATAVVGSTTSATATTAVTTAPSLATLAGSGSMVGGFGAGIGGAAAVVPASLTGLVGTAIPAAVATAVPAATTTAPSLSALAGSGSMTGAGALGAAGTAAAGVAAKVAVPLITKALTPTAQPATVPGLPAGMMPQPVQSGIDPKLLLFGGAAALFFLL